MADKTIIIDFETYYDADYTLRKMSTPEYVFDKRFLTFGMAVDVGGKQDFIVPKGIERFLKAHKGDTIVMHNGFFDAAILAWRYEFIPYRMLDTLAMANHVLGSRRDSGYENDLSSLADRLGLESKGKLDFMKGVRKPDEGQLAALAVYAKQDAKLERQVLEKLMPQITNPDVELWLIDHTLRIYITQPLPILEDKVRSAIKKVSARRVEIVAAGGVPNAVLASNPQFAAELTCRLNENGCPLPTKMRPFTDTERLKHAKLCVEAKEKGEECQPPLPRLKTVPALSKQDPQFMALVESEAKPVASLVRARLVERSATTALSRLNTLQKYNDIGGLRSQLAYYGAHTGRFSGAGGFNVQNLTNPERVNDPFDREVAELIRQSITAGKGMVFADADAAQIEARVNPWLAGEQQMLDAFASGGDLYSEFISDVLGEDIHKPGKDEANAAHLTMMRNIGKEAILGLGFGMGVEKFIVRLKARGMTKLFDDGTLSLQICAGIVKGYRDKYTQIVQFWKDLDSAMQVAIRGARRTVGHLTLKRSGRKDVAIVLPSGRELFYRDIRAEKVKDARVYIGVDGEEHEGKAGQLEWKHGSGQKLYGGLLAENVTQAVARDVLVEAIIDAEAAGYPVVQHVHDQIITRVPEKKGQEALDFLINTLTVPPSWAVGLVLGAEGKITRDLGKLGDK